MTPPWMLTEVTINVPDVLYITDNVTISRQIIVCSGGKLVFGHQDVPGDFTINFTNGANILVQDGGEIEAASGHSITLTSPSGNWDGIEFHGSGFGTLKNVIFNNSPRAITIDGAGADAANDILIESCTFNTGTIFCVSRNDVTIKNSTFNSMSSLTYPAISVIYGANITIYGNTITDARTGISISNSDPFVSLNTITNSSSTSSENRNKGIS